MIRKRLSVLALSLATLLCGAAQARQCATPLVDALPSDPLYGLTGTFAAGTYALSNVNVMIWNVTVVPCGGSTTFTLQVTNGSISVGSTIYPGGIVGAGTDGTDGATPGANGGAGTNGMNVVLETFPGTGTNDPYIYVAYGIDTSGGDGGSGANGNSGSYNTSTCAYTPPQSGGTAKGGSNGGNITINSASDILIASGLTTRGGDGGWGGSAGNNTYGTPGLARAGAPGGKGGNITLNHTAAAPTGALCRLYGAAFGGIGQLNAEGGIGGTGGSGGSGGSTGTVGGNGANGGNGGVITFTTKTLQLDPGDIYVGTSASTRGGAGGSGGDGGQYSPGNVHVDQTPGPGVCFDYCFAPGQGSLGGTAGNGGTGGAINATSADSVFIAGSTSAAAGCGMVSDGGTGGMGGLAGAGTAQKCFPTCPHEKICPTVYTTAASRTGGTGGNAGVITITAAGDFSCAIYGSVSATGGLGGDGQAGGTPGYGCCVVCPPDETTDYVVSASVVGGNGGAGGNGANINVNYATFTGYANFYFCGGLGGRGGIGGKGSTPGLGGWSGATGGSGSLFFNAVDQMITCNSETPVRAATAAAFTNPCTGN